MREVPDAPPRGYQNNATWIKMATDKRQTNLGADCVETVFLSSDFNEALWYREGSTPRLYHDEVEWRNIASCGDSVRPMGFGHEQK